MKDLAYWQRVLEQCEAATAGPWDDDGDGISRHWSATGGKFVPVIEMVGDSGWNGCDHSLRYSKEDGTFLVTSRTALPEAARVVVALHKLRKHWRARVRYCGGRDALALIDMALAGKGPGDE